MTSRVGKDFLKMLQDAKTIQKILMNVAMSVKEKTEKVKGKAKLILSREGPSDQ